MLFLRYSIIENSHCANDNVNVNQQWNVSLNKSISAGIHKLISNNTSFAINVKSWGYINVLIEHKKYIVGLYLDLTAYLFSYFC